MAICLLWKRTAADFLFLGVPLNADLFNGYPIC